MLDSCGRDSIGRGHVRALRFGAAMSRDTPLSLD
jgi:hypothetical protein